MNIEAIMLIRQQEITTEIEKLRIESNEIETTIRVMKRYMAMKPLPSIKASKSEPESESKEPEEPEPELDIINDIPIPSNRKQRRQFERARRKLDKFVTPSGPMPTPVVRTPRKTNTPPKPSKPKPPTPQLVGKPEKLIVEDDILYEIEEFYGQFNFRDTILDQLDRYFFYIERMKKSDKDAFALYHQVGGSILPYTSTWIDFGNDDDPVDIEKIKSQTVVPLWFHHQRPGFGCIAWGTDPRTEEYEKRKRDGKKRIIIPRFFYFRKFNKPSPCVQMVKDDGDIYCATVWWDEGKKGYGVPQEFYVFISADGKNIEVLRILSTEMKEIYSKRKHEWFDIPQRQWRIPNEYENWARTNGMTADMHLAHVFCTIMTRHEYAQSAMARIAVKKGDLTAIFCISPRRMAYFFQDRDITLTKNGAKQRVFHLVKPYSYTSKTGKEVNIKMHFRGLRNFTWAGYNVSVTVPGLDHLLLDELNIPVSDEHWISKGEAIIEPEVLGKIVSELPKTREEFVNKMEKNIEKF